MIRTSKVTEDINVPNGGEGLLSRTRLTRNNLGGGYAGTLVPMARAAGSSAAYANLPYTGLDGTAVAAGTDLANGSTFEIDTSGLDVILRHTVTTPGNGTEIASANLMG